MLIQILESEAKPIIRIQYFYSFSQFCNSPPLFCYRWFCAKQSNEAKFNYNHKYTYMHSDSMGKVWQMWICIYSPRVSILSSARWYRVSIDYINLFNELIHFRLWKIMVTKAQEWWCKLFLCQTCLLAKV